MNLLKSHFCLILLCMCLVLVCSSINAPPYEMRISCGSLVDVQIDSSTVIWHEDFAYTGGIPDSGEHRSALAPPLKTVRYFPLSEGPENCYSIKEVPHGRYVGRIFFGIADSSIDEEPLFDISVERTLIYSLLKGWTSFNDERAVVETIFSVSNDTASVCFHNTGHGDHVVLAIELIQLDARAYYFGEKFSEGAMLRTVKRLNCGAQISKFEIDSNGDVWGGDRFWSALRTFGQDSDRPITTKIHTKSTSKAPNFYPEVLYETALISTKPNLTYTINVDPYKSYSIWLHFSEIDPSVTAIGRVMNVLVNGHTIFQGVDIIRMTGGSNLPLVLNATVAISVSALTITLHPTNGTSVIISAIEIYEVMRSESQTLPEEVKGLQLLKDALGLPLRLGWKGDPCVPQQHPWIGVDCQFDNTCEKWFIAGLGLDNRGLRGFLPDEISQLCHLKIINISGNNIHGPIPTALGTITTLETVDLSYNFFNGSIPQSLGQLTSLRTLNLNGNSLSGRVPAALGRRHLHGASFKYVPYSCYLAEDFSW